MNRKVVVLGSGRAIGNSMLMQMAVISSIANSPMIAPTGRAIDAFKGDAEGAIMRGLLPEKQKVHHRHFTESLERDKRGLPKLPDGQDFSPAINRKTKRW